MLRLKVYSSLYLSKSALILQNLIKDVIDLFWCAKLYTQFHSNRLYHPHSTASCKDAHRTNKEIQSNNRRSRRNMIILTSPSQNSSLRQSTGERKVRQGKREGDERSALFSFFQLYSESFVKANSW